MCWDGRVKSRDRLVIGIALLVLVMTLPGFVLSALGMKPAAMVAGLGGLTVLLSAVFANRNIALALCLPMAFFSWAAMLAADSPWWAAIVMAAASAASGVTARWGYSGTVVIAPITIGFIISQPPAVASSSPALSVGAMMLVTTGLVAGIGWFLSPRLPRPKVKPSSSPRAGAYAAVTGLLTGAAAWAVSAMHLGHAGGWMIMTILIVVQPYLQDEWTRALNRVGGTILGFALSAIAIPLERLPSIVYALGAISMLVALAARALHHPYWVYTTFLTLSIVLMDGSTGSLAETAWQRLAATLVGALASLIAMAILLPQYRKSAAIHGVERY